MTLLQAILLGIVQGLTEFIPVSSTAHLVLASRVMNLSLSAQQLTSSIAVIQLGTLVAVIVYFVGDIWNITRAFVHDHFMLLKNGRHDQFNRRNGNALSHEAWLGWLVIIGSVPVAVVGLAFKKQIEGTFTKNLWVIATMMLVVAVLLAVAEAVGKKQRRMQDLELGDALAVGFAQCLALIPGSSRSGSTIMAGLFVGETRETAARFSFLLSIPAIAASGLLELKQALHLLPHDSLITLFVGTIVSAIIGYASIWFLLRYLRTHTTGVFIGYRLIVGIAILFMLFSGRISPL
ncbi:MAG: undecaprenyl-diphosphatase [Blastocatellia bacterium]|jgi:undecaprenyl-diphosphatase|nr:undecaprenyl-diphosphatase [Blastocatellia bacterium]